MNTRALVAEFIGTFTLVFIGAGAAALDVGGVIGAALAHGLVVIAFVYSYGHISGTYINPAVTIALWVGKQIDIVNAVGYVIVQLLGGILAGLVLNFLIGSIAPGLGATVLADGIDPIQGLIIEVILTFLLVNTIFNSAVSGKAGNLAPVAIGFTLIALILMGGPLTGAALNPARTLGPAIATGNFADLWLYIVGPIVGGILAAALYNGLFKPND